MHKGVGAVDLLEVRLLGRFRVHADAGAVPPEAWRTSKTRDLFRLLALSAGKPVAVDVILDALWPDVPPERGRASLRTAASQIRHVVGEEHVVREGTGLLLASAWIDAQAFESAAETAARALRRGEAAAGVSAAWDALNLYTGDLCEDAPYAEWAVAERHRLCGLMRSVLLDACDAACEIGWLRDAAELGHRALQVDPSSERGHRGLMRTYWRLGETEQALRLYDECRRVLADELGVDPGPETQAVHLELLHAPPVETVEPVLVGRAPVLRHLTTVMTSVVSTREARGVLVTGAPGSGRQRVVLEALAGWSARRVEVPVAPEEPVGAHDVVQALARSDVGQPPGGAGSTAALVQQLRQEPLALVLGDLERLDVAALRLVDDLLAAHEVPLLVLATASDGTTGAREQLGGRWERLALPPLTRDEAEELLAGVLHAPPAWRLTAELHEASAGNPAALVATGRHLLSSGQLVLTVEGMARAERARGQGPSHADARLALARASASELACRALDVLAVVDRPLPCEELARLLDVPVADLRVSLDPLTDYLVLRSDGQGYAVHDTLVRQAAYRWLRPSARRRLHAAVAAAAVLPPDVRAQQWLAAGEPALACAAALEAADAALLRGDHAQVRENLLLVRGHAERQDVDVGERVALLERLSDASYKLGRTLEARGLLDQAILLARTGAPEALARLHVSLGRQAATEADALLAYASAAEPHTQGRTRAQGRGQDQGRRQDQGQGQDQGQRQISLAVAARATGRSPDVATRLLRRAVQEADGAADLAAQVRARILLSGAAAQQRDIELSTTAARAALTLAEASADDDLFVRAGHAVAQSAVFLGDGLRQLPLLHRLRSRSLGLRDPVTVLDVGITWALALHATGSPGFHEAWESLDDLAGLGRTRLHRLVGALVHLERGRPAAADRLLHQVPEHLESVAADQATQVLQARLLSDRGDTGGAVAALCGVVGDTGHRGVRFLLPEAGARLAELLAPHDVRAADAELDRALRAARGVLHPREHVCVLRARAALLHAGGRGTAAHSLLVAASLTAQRAGLVFQEAECLELRGAMLDQLGWPGGARARASASELRSRAEAPQALVPAPADCAR